jgi:DNA-binding LytR/AlgR family response regulator
VNRNPADIFLYWNQFFNSNPTVMMIPFFIRYKEGLKRIDPSHVIRLESRGNYTNFVLTNNKIFTVRTTISAAMEKLREDIFIRINPATVVSVFFIDTIEKDHLTIGEKSFPIQKSYFESVVMHVNFFGPLPNGKSKRVRKKDAYL